MDNSLNSLAEKPRTGPGDRSSLELNTGLEWMMPETQQSSARGLGGQQPSVHGLGGWWGSAPQQRAEAAKAAIPSNGADALYKQFGKAADNDKCYMGPKGVLSGPAILGQTQNAESEVLDTLHHKAQTELQMILSNQEQMRQEMEQLRHTLYMREHELNELRGFGDGAEAHLAGLPMMQVPIRDVHLSLPHLLLCALGSALAIRFSLWTSAMAIPFKCLKHFLQYFCATTAK